MGGNAFETAVEVVREGYVGQDAVDEWMTRIQRDGQRYCALALDILLVEAPSVEPVVTEAAAVVGEEQVIVDPLFNDEFSYDDVPAEPVEY